MIFDWRTVAIITPLTLFVLWIYNKNPKVYSQLLRDPKKTWLKMSWWKTLAISVPILLVSLKLFPMLETFIEANLGSLTTEAGQTSQGAAMRKIVEHVGIRWTLLLSGGIFAVVAAGEEIIFRGIVFHYLRRRWNWAFALIMSSVLFGLSHLSEVGFAFPFVIHVMIAGAVFGIMYMKTGLLGSVITHSGYDFLLLATVALNI